MRCIQNGDPDHVFMSSESPLDTNIVRWQSVNSGRDDSAICPSDAHFLAGGGTYFGEIYGFMESDIILEVSSSLIIIKHARRVVVLTMNLCSRSSLRTEACCLLRLVSCLPSAPT